jgi:hypothetical protein
MNESGIRSFTAGEALEANRRVKLSSGSAVYADAYDRGIGYTVDSADSGAQVAVKLHNFPGTRKVTASEALSSGASVYGTANGKCSDDYADGAPYLGVALEGATGDGSAFEILPEAGGEEVLFSATAQSDALGTSSADEATFSNGSVTLPAGELKTGDVLRVRAAGTLVATNGTDTFTGKLKLGSETVATTPNPDAVNGDVFMIDALIVIREGGATGKVVGSGYVMNDALAAGLATPFHKAEAAEDLSGAIAIAVTGQFDASSAGNEARLQQFVVTRVRK